MKNIYLTGYKNQNLGDDLFFVTVLKRYPNIHFLFEDVPSGYYSKLFYGFDNIDVIPFIRESLVRRVLKKILKTIFKSWPGQYYSEYLRKNNLKVDAYLRIGGSIFIEPKKNLSDIKYLFEAEKKYFGKIPFFYIGCNFGPFSSNQYLRCADYVISGSSSICFRDSFSYNLFKHHHNVMLAPDVLFGLKKFYSGSKKVSKSLGISLIDFSSRDVLSNYYNSYLDSIRGVIENKNRDLDLIRLFSFCIPEGDGKAIDDLLNLLPPYITDKVEVVCYGSNYEEFLAKFSELEALIATRFHAMILGFVYGIKTTPIIYSKKMTHALDDIAEEVPCIDLKAINKESLLNNYLSAKVINIEKQTRDCFRQFSGFDSIVGL